MSDWICELCYKPADGDLPPSWDLILQSAICPDCLAKVDKPEAMVGGCFAFANDPRERAIVTM